MRINIFKIVSEDENKADKRQVPEEYPQDWCTNKNASLLSTKQQQIRVEKIFRFSILHNNYQRTRRVLNSYDEPIISPNNKQNISLNDEVEDNVKSDLQKELEKKFDELFGPLDDDWVDRSVYALSMFDKLLGAQI